TAVKLGLEDDMSVNPKAKNLYERRDASVKLAKAEFLETDKKGNREKLNPDSKLTRRQQLAEHLVKSDYLPRAYVNRIWGHFFGRGFTNPGPVDDFGEHTPLTHPTLPNVIFAQLMAVIAPLPAPLAQSVR